MNIDYQAIQSRVEEQLSLLRGIEDHFQALPDVLNHIHELRVWDNKFIDLVSRLDLTYRNQLPPEFLSKNWDLARPLSRPQNFWDEAFKDLHSYAARSGIQPAAPEPQVDFRQPIEPAATNATFMVSGLLEIDLKRRGRDRKTNEMSDVYQIWGAGAVELHCVLTGYAIQAERMRDYIHDKFPDFHFPGVYPYEVSEPFGRWFAEYMFDNGEVPTDGECLVALIGFIARVYAQSKPGHEDSFAEDLRALLTEKFINGHV